MVHEHQDSTVYTSRKSHSHIITCICKYNEIRMWDVEGMGWEPCKLAFLSEPPSTTTEITTEKESRDHNVQHIGQKTHILCTFRSFGFWQI